MKVLLIQGANMEYLGFREPSIYGTTTAQELNEALSAHAERLGIDLAIRYTNLEGEAISLIYAATRDRTADGLLMNPAGFTYAGYALGDCLRAIPLPYVEVHMSNLDARGTHSVTASAAAGVITGFGTESYVLGLAAIKKLLGGRHP